MNKKKKATFNIPNIGKRGKKRVKERWRKPRGVDNKKRIRKKSHGKVVKIGYKNDKKRRFLHPSGAKEFLIRNLKELLEVLEEFKENTKAIAIRFSSSLGRKKKKELQKIAEQNNVRVLNPLKEEKLVLKGKP